LTIANDTIWAITALSTFGVIVRPWNLPEATWAGAGAVMLVVFGLLPWGDALKAVAKGTDVYLFLSGMMLLAELARKEGLFDFLAGRAARLAGGSAAKLFALVYGVGTVVTIFMSNDATAVVLTPALFAYQVKRSRSVTTVRMLSSMALLNSPTSSYAVPWSPEAAVAVNVGTEYGGELALQLVTSNAETPTLGRLCESRFPSSCVRPGS